MQIKELIKYPIQLEEVFLVQMNLSRTSDKINGELMTNINIETGSRDVKVDTGKAILKINFSIIQNENELVKISLELCGVCKALEEQEDEIMQFIETQSIRMLWPYAKEILSNTMYKMGLPSIQFPTIDILNTLQANEK